MFAMIRTSSRVKFFRSPLRIRYWLCLWCPSRAMCQPMSCSRAPYSISSRSSVPSPCSDSRLVEQRRCTAGRPARGGPGASRTGGPGRARSGGAGRGPAGGSPAPAGAARGSPAGCPRAAPTCRRGCCLQVEPAEQLVHQQRPGDDLVLPLVVEARHARRGPSYRLSSSRPTSLLERLALDDAPAPLLALAVHRVGHRGEVLQRAAGADGGDGLVREDRRRTAGSARGRSGRAAT